MPNKKEIKLEIKREEQNAIKSQFRIGENFLKIAHLASKSITADWEFDSDENNEKWLIEEVAVPTLFNFYHGIEVMLKTIIMTNGTMSNGHSLKALIKKVENPIPTELMDLIKSYTTDKPEYSIMHHFVENIGIDIWYQALGYTTSSNGTTVFEHSRLKYKDSHKLKFWENLSDDCLKISDLTKQHLILHGVKFYTKNNAT